MLEHAKHPAAAGETIKKAIKLITGNTRQSFLRTTCTFDSFLYFCKILISAQAHSFRKEKRISSLQSLEFMLHDGSWVFLFR